MAELIRFGNAVVDWSRVVAVETLKTLPGLKTAAQVRLYGKFPGVGQPLVIKGYRAADAAMRRAIASKFLRVGEFAFRKSALVHFEYIQSASVHEQGKGTMQFDDGDEGFIQMDLDAEAAQTALELWSDESEGWGKDGGSQPGRT